MSLITRCPACATMFRVVPDQLRVSDGWVRCGQCDEVFDATVHMQPALAAEKTPTTSPDTSADVPAPMEAHTDVPPENTEGIGDDAQQDAAEVELAAALSWDTMTPDVLVKADPEMVPDPVPLTPDVDMVPRPAAEVSEPMPLLVQAREEQFERYVSDTQEGVQLSFMRAAPSASVWNRPLVRAGLALVSLVFGVVLVLQILVHERDRLAAMDPRVKPYLVSLCVLLDCQVAPWRQIDSVVIDSSSFVKVRADVYRLNLTLKNTSEMALASPSVELSLTDAQDTPVIRRVLSISEYAASQTVMAPGAELSVSLPLSIRLPSGAERISGYRLLAFYP